MYDSINFRLMQSDAVGSDFLSEIPCYLDNVGEHCYNGETVITGELGGLKISVNGQQMKVRDGSLCKWFLGSNYQTMGRGDTQRAIEALSDRLHVPMDKAAVTRIDIAQNFIMKHPTPVYLSHLGLSRYGERLIEPSGLYYHQTGGRLCFYDKNKEQKDKREDIPELYEGRNVLRYEQRYTKRLASQLKENEITGALLYDEAFYMKLVKKWHRAYKDIKKINDLVLNTSAMIGKRQMYKMAMLALVNQMGGQVNMINFINEAQKRGELSKKQAYDMRQTVNEACKSHEGLTVESEAIKELDKKMGDAVRFFR